MVMWVFPPWRLQSLRKPDVHTKNWIFMLSVTCYDGQIRELWISTGHLTLTGIRGVTIEQALTGGCGERSTLKKEGMACAKASWWGDMLSREVDPCSYEADGTQLPFFLLNCHLPHWAAVWTVEASYINRPLSLTDFILAAHGRHLETAGTGCTWDVQGASLASCRIELMSPDLFILCPWGSKRGMLRQSRIQEGGSSWGRSYYIHSRTFSPRSGGRAQ